MSGTPLPKVELPVLDATANQILAPSGPCLVNFWATWCHPCRAEMPSLNRLYNEFVAGGLKVYAVSADEDLHLIREFLISVKVEFPILLDPGARQAMQVFAVTSFPTTLLVDRNNRIREVWVGERDWDALPIRNAVKVLFEG